MDGPSRFSTWRRRRGRLSRAALVAVIALLGLVAVPGTASATTRGVTPFVDCVRQHGNNGSYTVVLGYTNSSRSTVTIPLGSRNFLSPSKDNGAQPTRFQPGTHHGAFSVGLSKKEYQGLPFWHLDGEVVFFSAWGQGDPSCPSPTELPEEGNGTGPAIALVVAGVIGAAVVHRFRRRTLASAAAPARDGGGDA
jgi:hypothetical protein